MQSIPTTRYLRLRQIIGDFNANPPIPPIVPCCASSWWAWTKAGKIKAYKLSPGVTVWKFEDVIALAEKVAGDQ